MEFEEIKLKLNRVGAEFERFDLDKEMNEGVGDVGSIESIVFNFIYISNLFFGIISSKNEFILYYTF